MKIAYYFDEMSDEPFYYEDGYLRDFIEDTIPYDELIDIYIEEVYKKDAKEREALFDEFGWKTVDEVRDNLYEDDSNDWIIDSIVDYAESYVEDEYRYEIEKYFEEDAAEEYVAELESAGYEDELNSDYFRSRL